MPSARPFPSSGIFLGPSRNRPATRITNRCVGCSKPSNIDYPPLTFDAITAERIPLTLADSFPITFISGRGGEITFLPFSVGEVSPRQEIHGAVRAKFFGTRWPSLGFRSVCFRLAAPDISFSLVRNKAAETESSWIEAAGIDRISRARRKDCSEVRVIKDEI